MTHLEATSVAMRILTWLDLNLASAASRSFCLIIECSTTQSKPSSVHTIPNICVYLQYRATRGEKATQYGEIATNYSENSNKLQ